MSIQATSYYCPVASHVAISYLSEDPVVSVPRPGQKRTLDREDALPTQNEKSIRLRLLQCGRASGAVYECVMRQPLTASAKLFKTRKGQKRTLDLEESLIGQKIKIVRKIILQPRQVLQAGQQRETPKKVRQIKRTLDRLLQRAKKRVCTARFAPIPANVLRDITTRLNKPGVTRLNPRPIRQVPVATDRVQQTLRNRPIVNQQPLERKSPHSIEDLTRSVRKLALELRRI